MTTYSYTVTLDDSESIMLKFALELTIKHCQEKLDQGAGAPYWAHLQSAKSVLEGLHADVTQSSGNNFSDFKGDKGLS